MKVSFHAHPDDEALLTGGTLARAAAEGHRVVLVTATDGGAGATSAMMARDLGRRRCAELEEAAAALGVARVVHLGLADSGCGVTWTGDPRAFSCLPVEEAAAGLTDVLRAERADVLTVYDAAGGYGHPDHRQVHAAGWFAARAAGTPSVLEAAVDRTLLVRAAPTPARPPTQGGRMRCDSCSASRHRCSTWWPDGSGSSTATGPGAGATTSSPGCADPAPGRSRP